MASSQVAKAKVSAAAPDTSKVEKAAASVAGVSRREFLYYAWAASIALLLAQTGGIIIWFALPRFREGEFGGVFALRGVSLPDPGGTPDGYPAGKFWLSYTADGGVVALYQVCTHLGCLYKWVEANRRFECPCHGSKFQTNGLYIEGPATRSLDRFAITVVTKSGQELPSNAAGDPVIVAASDVADILVDTGKVIKRAGKV
jgi:cytochrome b6-f complex iron-sulfur subunit